jgi:hypothetical protein
MDINDLTSDGVKGRVKTEKLHKTLHEFPVVRDMLHAITIAVFRDGNDPNYRFPLQSLPAGYEYQKEEHYRALALFGWLIHRDDDDNCYYVLSLY